jgi:hypothetical protein
MYDFGFQKYIAENVEGFPKVGKLSLFYVANYPKPM